jgi:hypothetical protein
MKSDSWGSPLGWFIVLGLGRNQADAADAPEGRYIPARRSAPGICVYTEWQPCMGVTFVTPLQGFLIFFLFRDPGALHRAGMFCPFGAVTFVF